MNREQYKKWRRNYRITYDDTFGPPDGPYFEQLKFERPPRLWSRSIITEWKYMAPADPPWGTPETRREWVRKIMKWNYSCL